MGKPVSFRKKLIRFLLIGLAIGFIPTFYIIAWRTWFMPHAETFPSDIPTTPVPEIQAESHTCGMHSLRSVYAAYGMDPNRENLRNRLGVDFYGVFWNHDSTGAYHADIYMVLGQDHFSVTSIDVESEDAASELTRHLQNQQLAMFLIERQTNGHLHWVVASDADDKRIRIVDSLEDVPYWEPTKKFLSNYVISALLIQPETRASPPFPIASHLNGSLEILRSLARMGKSKGTRNPNNR